MDKNYFINEYLEGKRPIEKKSWELPSESELDRDEALYDALLVQNKKAPLQASPRGGRLWVAAAVLIAALALFTWWNFKPEGQPQLAEKTKKIAPEKDTLEVIEKRSTLQSPTQHAAIANAARCDRQRSTLHFPKPQQTVAEAPQSASDSVVLLNAADSLYYYLTQLENQMGDCRDSACLNELTGLMRADERIKDLVNKIIHRQVETAYQEEYLVDTTIRYIPL